MLSPKRSRSTLKSTKTTCNKPLYIYKTDKGFLCNTKVKSLRGSWCEIRNTGNISKTPYESRVLPYIGRKIKWDYIKNEGCFTYGDNDVVREPSTCCNHLDDVQLFSKIMFYSWIFNHLATNVIHSLLNAKGLINHAIMVASNHISSQKLMGYLETLKRATTKAALGRLLKDIMLDYSDDMDSALFSTGLQPSGKQQNAVIYKLIEKVPDKDFLDVLGGGCALIDDGGDLYDLVKSPLASGGYARFSSHSNVAGIPTTAQQYASTSLFYGYKLHGLSGKVDKPNIHGDSKTMTWVQLEGSPMPAGRTGFEALETYFTQGNPRGYITDVVNLLDHTFDFITYKVKGLNVGPWGFSPFRDSKPIFISDHPEDYEGLVIADTFQEIRENVNQLNISDAEFVPVNITQDFRRTTLPGVAHYNTFLPDRPDEMNSTTYASNYTIAPPFTPSMLPPPPPIVLGGRRRNRKRSKKQLSRKKRN